MGEFGDFFGRIRYEVILTTVVEAIVWATTALYGFVVTTINQRKTDRYKLNENYDKEIRKKQNKDPKNNKLIGVPIPKLNPNKKVNNDDNDDNPEKKNNNEPVSDKKPDQKPQPKDDEAPKTNFKRIIPPEPIPVPPINKGPILTPPSIPISVKNPPYFKKTGTFIYQPVEPYKVNLWSMPNNLGDSDFTELITAQQESNKVTDYIDFLKDSKLGLETGKYPISDLLPVIMSPAGIIDANPTLLVGTEIIGNLKECYENYSDGFLSNPIWFVPSEIEVHTINGLSNNKRRLDDDFNTLFKPINLNIPEFILNSNIFNIPKEVTIEQLLEFAGNCAIYEGGAEKWELYKENPTILSDPIEYENLIKNWNIPSSDDILNEDIDPNNTPKYQQQNLKINSFQEQLLIIAGTLYVKLGLNELPTSFLPGLKNPKPIPEDSEKNDQLEKSNVALRIGNLTGLLSYFANWFNFKLGDFPNEIKINDENNDTTTYKFNISQGLSQLLTISLGTLAVANINKNINLANAAEIELTKNAALSSAECACVNTANSGFNTKRKSHCNDGAFDFINSKGVLDMLKGGNRCREGIENEDSATIKAMLENILFGVNIIKSAFFKGSKEIDNQKNVLKDLLKNNIDEKELDKFIDDFNNEKLLLNKDYPIKSKIVRVKK